MLINIWPTYDLPVRTEAGRKSTTRCILIFICLKDSASLLFCHFSRGHKQQRQSKQTNTHARNNKINEGKEHRKNTNGNMQSVTMGKKAKNQQSRILQAYEN
jgi:hypothetical protein